MLARLWSWLNAYDIICSFHGAPSRHLTRGDGSVHCYSLGIVVKPAKPA